MQTFGRILGFILLINFSMQPAIHGLAATPKEVYDAIVCYNRTQIKSNQSDSKPLNLSRTKDFCRFENLVEKIFMAVPLSLLVFLMPDHASLGGDILTGNPFVEGTSEEEFIRLKINQSLIRQHHISLLEEFEIFLHLREDQTERSHYLDNRPNKELILATLQKREARLFQKLRALTSHIFYFRKHPSLHEQQENVLIALIILISTMLGLYLAASFDIKTDKWHDPNPLSIQKNIHFIVQKIIN